MGAEWLKGCEICNAGLCARIDELIDQGMSRRRAAKELEKDQREQLGEVVYSAEALRNRFQTNRKSKIGRISTIPVLETCAVLDLQDLIKGGREGLDLRPPDPQSGGRYLPARRVDDAQVAVVRLTIYLQQLMQCSFSYVCPFAQRFMIRLKSFSAFCGSKRRNSLTASRAALRLSDRA